MKYLKEFSTLEGLTTAVADSSIMFVGITGNDWTPVVMFKKIPPQPFDEIWYTSTDGQVVVPNELDYYNQPVDFGAQILSNTYTNGKGVIKFDGPVTQIGGDAFSRSSPTDYGNLQSIAIPNSVTTIGDYAFYLCGNLTSVTIPGIVTSIGEGAFQACINLESVNIPNSVTSIGQSAFSECSSLTSVTIPSGIATIGGEAFAQVLNINYTGTATGSPWGARCVNGYVENGLCYTNTTKTVLVGVPRNISGSVTIPDNVTSIGGRAFSSCNNLTSVTISNSVTSIGQFAFTDCKGLTSVTFGSGVTNIDSYAFQSCSGLTSVNIPNSVTSIGEYVFYNCTGLMSITCEPTTPPTLAGTNAFSNTNCPIYVPAASVDTYKAANNWSSFASRIQAIPA